MSEPADKAEPPLRPVPPQFSKTITAEELAAYEKLRSEKRESEWHGTERAEHWGKGWEAGAKAAQNESFELTYQWNAGYNAAVDFALGQAS